MHEMKPPVDVCPPDIWRCLLLLLAGMKEPPWHNNKHHRLVDSGQLLIDRLKLADVSGLHRLLRGVDCGVILSPTSSR
jgi:hypothetical protein